MNHAHPHDGHTHTRLPAGEQPPAGGPVVLDIGDDVGALIVHLGRHLIGHELHLRPDPEQPATIHTGIWERSANGHAMIVAVFPQLVAGSYELLDPDGHPNPTVTIQPGTVRELHLHDATD